MKVTEITISAGRTFNHPYEQYSNLRPQVTLKASLSEGDNPESCVKELQAKAEGIVDDHKRVLLESIHESNRREMRNREIARLESLIKTGQESLERLRSNGASLPAPAPEVHEDDPYDDEDDDDEVDRHKAF